MSADAVGPGRTSEPSPVSAEVRRFVWHNAVAGGATIVGGALGFALQGLASHTLHPGDYGRAISVFTFFTLLTQPSAGFARLVTWNTSRHLAAPGFEVGDSGVLLRDVTKRLLMAGLVLTGLAILGGHAVAAYLHVPFEYIVVGALAVPFMLATAPLIGDLQGQERFVPWSVLTLLVSGSRLLFVAGLVFTAGAIGFLWGISVASGVTFFITLGWVWPRMRNATGRFQWRARAPFIVIAVASTVAISIFLSIDVLMVGHFFDKARAGEYDAMAALSRSIYFVTGAIASVQFPKVAARHARQMSTIGVVTGSLVLCVAGGTVGVLFLHFFGRVAMRGFSGNAYIATAKYLWWYGAGMTMLGAGVILLNTQQSLSRLSLLWFLVPVTTIEPLLILFFHHTLFSVVLDSDISIAIFLVVMGILCVRTESSGAGSSLGTT